MPKALSYYKRMSSDRNSAISRAYQAGGYTLKEIGDHFGLHHSTVSGAIINQRPEHPAYIFN